MNYVEASRVLVFISSFVVLFGLYAQVFKIWRNKSVKDISAWLPIAIFTSEIFFLNYGIAIREWPIIAIGCMSVPGSFALLVGYIKFWEGDIGIWIWNLYALSYNSLNRLSPYKEMMRDLLEAMKIYDGIMILDAGCGTGNLEKEVLKTGKSVQMLAIDFSGTMLKIAKTKVKSADIMFKNIDLTSKLPFKKGEFDIIICNNVLYTISDVDNVLCQLENAVKANGKIIISDPKKGSSCSEIIRSHCSAGERLERVRKIIGILRPDILFSLIYIGIVNVVINRAETKGHYSYRNKSEWQKLLGEHIIIEETYANQNWLIIKEF